MTVTLEVEPDILEAAREEAEQKGITTNDVLKGRLRRLLPIPEQKPLTMEEYRAVLAEMREIMKDAPVLPPDAFTRESISDD